MKFDGLLVLFKRRTTIKPSEIGDIAFQLAVNAITAAPSIEL